MTVNLHMIGVPGQISHYPWSDAVKHDWIIANFFYTLQTIHKMILTTYAYSKLTLPIIPVLQQLFQAWSGLLVMSSWLDKGIDSNNGFV